MHARAPGPLGGSGGMLPQENLVFRLSEIASGAFLGKCFSLYTCHLKVLVVEFQGGGRAITSVLREGGANAPA